MAVPPFGDGPTYTATLYLSVVARGIAGSLLFRAGLAKARDQKDFAASLAQYTLVPKRSAKTAAKVLTTLELVVAFLVVAGVVTRESLAAASLLFLAFATAMIVDLQRDRVIPCGCGITPWSEGSISWRKVAGNFSVAAICGAAAAAASDVFLQPLPLLGLTLPVALAVTLGVYALALRHYAPGEVRRIWIERWTRQHCRARPERSSAELTLMPTRTGHGSQEAESWV